MTLPGNMPAPNTTVIIPPSPPAAKSWFINDVDEEVTRVLATTSPNLLIFTYSLWIKPLSYHSVLAGGITLFSVIDQAGDTSHYTAGEIFGPDSDINLEQNQPLQVDEVASLTTDAVLGVWQHYVFRYDSTQGTSDNRVRMYQNGGGAMSDTGTIPSLNRAHHVFENGFVHRIGPWFPLPENGERRMAFIDVLEGVSVDNTAFGFNNAGTWTRKPYVGSRGTYGFSIDGTDGLNDVSGNGQHFTGTNMDASNFSTTDLPPFVMV